MSFRSYRPFIAAIAGFFFATQTLAQNAAIRLTCFPAISVADGRSTVTVNADIRDQNGRTVPDGTQVVFSTSNGTFRENVVQTFNGLARAILVSGTIPGTATITASALSYNANATLDIEYVGDRSLLSSANEYIEVVAPKYLMYSSEMRTLGAAGEERAVKLRYKDIEIEADDLQLKVPSYEVRARHARMRFGKETREYDQLYMKLNNRKGTGLTVFPSTFVRLSPSYPFFDVESGQRDRLGLVDISSTGIKASAGLNDPKLFDFEDLGDSMTLISSKKAVVYPAKEIQFHKADIVVGSAKVMRLPLFQISTQTSTPIVTDQFVNVTNNQLAINYPHYLSLKPGETSLLRLRSGTRYGRGTGAAGGTFLDYELNWNRGDDMDGGMTVSALGRTDWGINMHQYLRLGDRTTASAQIDFPANRSLFGSASINRQFDGFQASLSANAGRTLRGFPYANQQYYLTVEKDPTKIGKLPLRLFYGIGASESSVRTDNYSRFQQSVGLRTRLQMLPLSIGRASSLNASLSLSQQSGHNVQQGFALGGATALSTRISKDASLLLTYEYLDDGFNSQLIGRHKLSAQTYWNAGRTTLSLFAAKSLDIDRTNIFGDLSYRFNGLWRTGLGYSLDRYQGQSLLDYSVLLGYRIGFREVGLSWSNRTHRIGFELLGASFN